MFMRQAALKAILLGLAVGGTAASQAAAPAAPQGKITVREYNNIGGTAIADLTSNKAFPDSPDVLSYSDRLEWPTGPDDATPPPGDVKNNYGWTITGYVYPPKTGDYIFALAADDGADVWLSTDDNPANAVKICNESQWNPVRAFGSEARRAKLDEGTATERWENVSKPIRLTAGKAYYIQARAKEGGGGDNLAVAWSNDGSLPADGAEPISGGVLSTVDRSDFAAPYAGSLVVTPASFAWELNDGGGAGAKTVDAASVKLEVDGAAVSSAKVAKNGSVTTVSYDVSPFYAAGSSHKAKITFNGITVEKTFTIGNYKSLTAGMRVTPDASKPGFSVFTHQVSVGQGNDTARTERQLAGELKDADGNVLPNIADLSGATENGRFAVPEVINFSQSEGENNGNFTPDLAMPGIPGTEGGTDNIAMEILTFIELPKGFITMGVNSDDGFLTSAGNLKDKFGRRDLGEFNGGRGASDTTFGFAVEEAGTFAFRTIWEEGGGGANIEWFSVDGTGKKTLINDRAGGGFKAYRAATAQGFSNTVVTKVAPGVDAGDVLPGAEIELVISEGTDKVDTTKVALSLDGATLAATSTKAGSTITVKAKPASELSVGKHSATISFPSGATTRTETWSFTVPAFSKDKVKGNVGQVIGGAAFTADAGGRTGKAGDRAIDIGGAGGSSVLVKDGTFANAAATANTLSVSLWQKEPRTANSSIMWFTSTDSTEGARGFQAHTPWSDNTIYFDTAGCCGGSETRINANISTFPGFTDNTFWNSWHHLVFVKDGDHKSIYIDGVLFHEGDNTKPLSATITELHIGADNANNNNFPGTVDDFAVYASGLTAAQVKSLFTGTAPDALGASAKLIAYWPFDDAPAAPSTAVNVLSTKDAIRPTTYNNPAAEGVANVLDVKSATKYLNFDKLNTGFVVIPAAGNSVLTGIALTSANDAPERDPASYLIEGSNNGTTFTKVAEGAVAKFTARFQRQQIDFANTTAYAAYRVTFPTVANATSADSMQIADVELLGSLTGSNANLSFAPNKITTSLAAGKLTITYTGVLQSATTVKGTYSNVANAKSPFVVTPSAAAVFYRAQE